MKKVLSFLFLLLAFALSFGQPPPNTNITIMGSGTAGGGGGVTNLSVGTRTATTYPISNSNGTGFTLGVFTTNAGLVPGIAFPDGTQFLRDDGTWATPPGFETNLLIQGFTSTTFDISNTNGFGVTIPAFTATDPGIVRESGGGTTNFLRADNTWAVPPSGADGANVQSNLSVGTRTSTTYPILNSDGTGFTLNVFGTNAGLVPGTTSNTTDFLRADGTWATVSSGSGDVVGPGSSTTRTIPVYSGTTGKLLTTSPVAISTAGVITLPAVTTPTVVAGDMWYDNTSQSLAVKNSEADITLNVGQETWVRVYNNTGSTITNGQAVYITGADAGTGLPTVALARADAVATLVVAGLATHSIENGTVGYITSFGSVRDLNTSGFTAGAIWLSPTTAGALTQTASTAPNYQFRVGSVSVVNAATGVIHVQLGAGTQVTEVISPTNAAANSTYPDNSTYWGRATVANGFPIEGMLTGLRKGTENTQRIQDVTTAQTYARAWLNGSTAWTAWSLYQDSHDYTAKGQIAAGTGNNAFSMLPAGTTGQVLTANTATATGVEWATGVSSPDARLIVKHLAANATANATTTGVKITGLDQSLTAGTYTFQYFIRYQSSITTTGVKFGINFTGTNTVFLAYSNVTNIGTTAIATVHDQENASITTQGTTMTRTKSTTAPNMGPATGVGQANSDMFWHITGILVVTATGNIELWHGSETAAATTVMANTSLILTKTN